MLERHGDTETGATQAWSCRSGSSIMQLCCSHHGRVHKISTCLLLLLLLSFHFQILLDLDISRLLLLTLMALSARHCLTHYLILIGILQVHMVHIVQNCGRCFESRDTCHGKWALSHFELLLCLLVDLLFSRQTGSSIELFLGTPFVNSVGWTAFWHCLWATICSHVSFPLLRKSHLSPLSRSQSSRTTSGHIVDRRHLSLFRSLSSNLTRL